MISKHSAHSTSLPIGFRTWLWRYTCLLFLISMLWHRQAIFESKGDKLSSSWYHGPRCSIERYNSVLGGDRNGWWISHYTPSMILSTDIEKKRSKQNTVARSKMYINKSFYIAIALHVHGSLSIIGPLHSLVDSAFQIIVVVSDYLITCVQFWNNALNDHWYQRTLNSGRYPKITHVVCIV